MSKIAIIMGSKSDLETMQETADVLKEFGVEYQMRGLSAHRTPKEVVEYALSAKDNGIKVIIAGAGGAAALAGVIAAHTTLPVIGVPIETKSLKGMDSLLSTVQMPDDIPVACMAIGKPGAKNAGLLALEILAISDNGIQKKLERYKKDLVKKVKEIRL